MLVKTNSGIEIKTLIADMHQRYLPVWLTAAQHFVPGTIVKYKTSSSMEEGDDDPPRVILNRLFWAFNPCIEGFKYCKPLVQVDGTFLTGKYHSTLLTAIRQDGSRNNFSLAFAIIESETKEAWMWFLHYLRRYVTPQLNLCIISDRGTDLITALQFERVGWNGPDVSFVYCIRHIASNFNKQFKNVDLEKQVINMGMFFPISCIIFLLYYMFTKFITHCSIFSHTNQAYDEGKRYDHITTNLAECMNFVLKGARALPFTVLVYETFNKINDLFVTNDIKIMNMIKAGHRYSKVVYVMMQENQHIVTLHYVRMYVRDRSLRFKKLQICDLSCDCGQFQALRLPCSYTIAACAFCNLNYDDFIDPVYKLEYIFKVYQHQFHSLGSEDTLPQYLGPHFMSDPSKRRQILGRPTTT
ncbi:hypothetical protein HKD37_07G018958 [Glycine soja]